MRVRAAKNKPLSRLERVRILYGLLGDEIRLYLDGEQNQYARDKFARELEHVTEVGEEIEMHMKWGIE